MSTLKISDRHALVCGASSGIGRATALALAAQGVGVTVLARTEAKLQALLPKLLEAGASRARYLVADLDDRPRLGQILQGFLNQHGPIHILVNNTGGPLPGAILDATEEDFLKAFGRHLLANHLLVTQTVPGMRQAGWGRIINVISIAIREPLANLGVSNATRGAVAAWAKTMSRELPPGITINNVLPGLAATDRLFRVIEQLGEQTGRDPEEIEAEWTAGVPEGRIGAPDELGQVIAFLASDAASYVRGTSIPVDGGRHSSI